MPLMHVTAGQTGAQIHGAARPLDHALGEGCEAGGPVIIMIHGYKFAPGHAIGCPHRHILSLEPKEDCWKALSWPRELGFGSGFGDEGLGIAFGWNARGTIWQAYARAEATGHVLADLITDIHKAAPGRPVHVLAHSLGARVALSAMHHLAPGALARVILLNPAEYGAHARAALDSPAGRRAEVINVTSRENDLFDFLLERLVAPPERGDRTLAHALPARANTLTLQIDCHDTLRALEGLGFAIAPPLARICHWSAYLRPGVFSLYRALLRRPERFPLALLHASLPGEPAPRWSRVLPLPELRLPMPTGRNAV